MVCDFLVLLCVGEVVGLVVVLICEVFWLKTKGWKVCWFGVVLRIFDVFIGDSQYFSQTFFYQI